MSIGRIAGPARRIRIPAAAGPATGLHGMQIDLE
jgi:hypothetical protein